jgi:DNA-binding IclR family transcriptional regulator
MRHDIGILARNDARHDKRGRHVPVNPAPAALRALDVLDVLALEPGVPLSLAEIARRADLPRTTCLSVLLALVERGFAVRHDSPIAYTLGSACIRLGDAAVDASPLLSLAGQAARDLHTKTGLSTGVLTRHAGTLKVDTATTSTAPFAAQIRRGHQLPYVAPFGAAFAAWDPDPMVNSWLDACEPPLDTDERDRLVRALASARRRGYSLGIASDQTAELVPLIEPSAPAGAERKRRLVERVALMAHRDYLAGELHPTRAHRVSQWSAPVIDHNGRVHCILIMAGPAQPLSPRSISELGALVADIAAHTSYSPASGQ